jgi:3-hydroxyisobutyrate dehydrogenase-like beta-hydroxyacid dehydrogenase
MVGVTIHASNGVETMTVLLLNPGQMGERVGFAAVSSGVDVTWASAGRGAATRERAMRAGLRDAGTLASALASAEVVLSVVPPHAALVTAQQVAAQGFAGVYVDMNAVSPQTGSSVAAALEASGGSYVDGGIIGPPPSKRGDTRLYLAGPAARQVAGLFENSVMDARVLDELAGSTAASALKMAYAGWTKASSALLMNVRALARANNVEQALLDEWDISQPGTQARSAKAATANAFKAWRFIGEMQEIAATMEASGLPDGFHLGAADLYRRLEGFKDDMQAEPEAVYAAIVGPTAGS